MSRNFWFFILAMVCFIQIKYPMDRPAKARRSIYKRKAIIKHLHHIKSWTNNSYWQSKILRLSPFQTLTGQNSYNYTSAMRQSARKYRENHKKMQITTTRKTKANHHDPFFKLVFYFATFYTTMNEARPALTFKWPWVRN